MPRKPKSETTAQYEWISNDSVGSAQYVTIDKHMRFYLSTGARKLFGLTTQVPAEFYVGYDKVNRRLIFGKAGVVRPTDVKPFKFDARSYASARAFVKQTRIDDGELPLRYEYVGKDYSAQYAEGAHAFQLTDHQAPDEPKAPKD